MKTFFLTISLLFSISGIAQDDRTSNSLPAIDSTVLWSLKAATGWIKNKEGQWLEGKNKIQKYSMSLASKDTWETNINITGLDNFLGFQVQPLKIGGADFIILIKLLKDGDYRYKALKSGWEPFTKVRYYVIKRNEAERTVAESFSEYKMQVYFCGFMKLAKDYMTKIALDISRMDNEEPDYKRLGTTRNLTFSYKELADGKTCRFYIGSFVALEDDLFDTYPANQEIVWPLIHFPDAYYYECDKSKLAGILKLIEKT